MRTSRRTSLPGSVALAEQGPRDDESLDLLGPLVELGDLRVAHHPLDRELVDVAVAAQDLDGVGRDPHRGVTGDEFTHAPPSDWRRGAPASISTQALYRSWRAASVPASMSASIAPTIWNSPMRWPNCLRSRGVRGRDLERALGDPDGLGGDARPAAVERAHRDVEPVALLAEPVRRRDAHAVERELGGRAAADAHLVLEAGDGEAVGRDLDDEGAAGGDGGGASGSVTAKTTMRSATEPWLMNRFAPSMT